MEYSDRDIKKYDPKKSSQNRKSKLPNSLSDSVAMNSEMSEENENLRAREENYLFRGYGSMMDTSEMIDFSEGTDSY